MLAGLLAGCVLVSGGVGVAGSVFLDVFFGTSIDLDGLWKSQTTLQLLEIKATRLSNQRLADWAGTYFGPPKNHEKPPDDVSHPCSPDRLPFICPSNSGSSASSGSPFGAFPPPNRHLDQHQEPQTQVVVGFQALELLWYKPNNNEPYPPIGQEMNGANYLKLEVFLGQMLDDSLQPVLTSRPVSASTPSCSTNPDSCCKCALGGLLAITGH